MPDSKALLQRSGMLLVKGNLQLHGPACCWEYAAGQQPRRLLARRRSGMAKQLVYSFFH